MTDHTEIPADVMEAARCHAKAYYDTRSPKSIQWEFDVLMVARAILSERERAAKVAYTYADEHSGDHKMVGHIIGRKILFTKR